MRQEYDDQCDMCDCLSHFIAQNTVESLQVEVLKQLALVQYVQKCSCFVIKGDALTENVTLTAYQGDIAMPHDAKLWAKHELLQKCIVNQEIQHFNNHQTCGYLIPIKHYDHSVNIWIIESVEKINKDNITLMVGAYKNCTKHISQNNHDALTGLKNRRAYNERIEKMMHKNRRSSDGTTQLVTLCVLDIDFFKRVNDNFGHLYGDEVLLLFSTLMKSTFREKDLLYRYGGEEFVVLLMTNTEKEAFIALDRFRLAVGAYDFPQVGHITVSIGYVSMNETTLPSSLFDRADKALYHAKEHGRNQLCSYQNLVTEGLAGGELTDTSDLELF